MRLSSFIIKQILDISQAIGLGDPDSGCSPSPLIFLRPGAREIMAKEFLPLLLPVPCGALTVIGGQHPASSEVSMIVLDKIKAFLKWYGKRMGFLEPKPEAKVADPPETKVAEAPEKKGNESSSK